MRGHRLSFWKFYLAVSCALATSFGLSLSSTGQSQSRCPPGFDFQPNSGVGCVQANCFDIGYLDYTGHCTCPEGKTGCFEEVNYEAFDINVCFPFCPYSTLISCIDAGGKCPQQKAANPPPAGAADGGADPDEAGKTKSGEKSSKRLSREELAASLEEFLAKNGITSPTPKQIAAGGVSLAGLLLTWLLLNRFSGVDAETSLEVIRDWRYGGSPPETPPPTPPVTPPPVVPPAPPPIQVPPDSIKVDKAEAPVSEIPASVPDVVTEQDAAQKPAPARESAEEAALRRINDIQDLDDALKKTNKDIESFEEKIPESVRESETWKEYVKPKLEQIKEFLKQGELDKGRTWLDRGEALIKLRAEVDRDLSHLPADQREAILWVERTLRVLGNFASDAYQRLVLDPAKAAGKAVLPPEVAGRFNKSLDELGEGLANVPPQVSEAVRKHARVLTHGKEMDIAREWEKAEDSGVRDQGREIREMYGPRDVPVEYPDFWGKGMKKLKDIKDTWNNTGGRLSRWLRIK